ncbi:MAG TPA: AAA family ATPase [Actinomycetota bacterium]|nr:AAA family ATPase [Actinomycetota bacterium]
MSSAPPVAAAAFAPLGLLEYRTGRAVVGRPAELAAIEDGITTAAGGRLSAVAVEGEPGIGKTRLLLAAREIALAKGFLTVAVGADEELRGPFLLARSIVGAPEVAEAVAGTPSEAAIASANEALGGRDDPAFAGLSSDQRLLRSFDLATMAIRALTAGRPLALLIDDMQWADEDSLRLLRYVIRTEGASPIFLMFSIRPEEVATLTEAVTLLADMERMRVIRRLKLARFSVLETTEFLRQVLGGQVEPATASTIHGQAEGVPFIVEEIGRAYREAGMLQQIADTWTLARNAERLAPSAVRTLIQRRAAHLPAPTKTALAEAALLGRHFSLKDLREVRVRGGEGEQDDDLVALGDLMSPAVAAGLLVEQPEDAPADYTFPHEQVREFAADTLAPARRREIHGAIVELLMTGEPAPETLPLLAHHARAAGDAEVCVRFSTEAAAAALAAHAPEEVLRVVEIALPQAATPQERLGLLTARDDALAMLRRPGDRLEGLAELAALAEALGDPHLDLDVTLRRAAALRLSQQDDDAAELAARVRTLAIEREDRVAELAACVELGQALVQAGIGEGFSPSAAEVDLDAAEETYLRAAALAEELGDTSMLAASTRELGVIDLGRIRGWFVERVAVGEHVPVMERVAAGEALEDLVEELPIAPWVRSAGERFHRSLALYEGLGDRQGMMASIIAMAYLSWAPDIHIGSDSARHIEEIRRLATQLSSFTSESQRAFAEVQMLYGVHVFARAKVIPDLAISRGAEAYERARAIGDRQLEFLSAGGTALSLLELGDAGEATTWLDRAGTVAAESPTPSRARQLELWRGLLHAARGDADGMREHFERAVEMAAEQSLPAVRCEVLAELALASATLGRDQKDENLLARGERAASEAKELLGLLPGHATWGARADAALATVALARDLPDLAADAARSAVDILTAAQHEDLDLDVLLPVAAALTVAGTDEEGMEILSFLRLQAAVIANRIVDEGVRTRWFRGPIGSALASIAEDPGKPLTRNVQDGSVDGLSEDDGQLLKLVVQGLSNEEIADRLRVDTGEVARRLASTYAKIGASSRADATAFAFQSRML